MRSARLARKRSGEPVVSKLCVTRKPLMTKKTKTPTTPRTLWPPVSSTSGSLSWRPWLKRKAWEKMTEPAATRRSVSKLLLRSTTALLSAQDGVGVALVNRRGVAGSALRMRLLPDREIVVGGVELGAVGAPAFLLDDAVDFAQPLRRDAQGHHLADPHHHVPRDDLDPRRREARIEAGVLEMLLDLRQRLRLVVTQEDGEEHGAVVGACRRRRRGGLRQGRRRHGERCDKRERGQAAAQGAPHRRPTSAISAPATSAARPTMM